MDIFQNILFKLFGVVGTISLIVLLLWGVLWSILKFKVMVNRIGRVYKYMAIEEDLKYGKLLLDKDGISIECSLLPYIKEEEKIEICNKAINRYTGFIQMRKTLGNKKGEKIMRLQVIYNDESDSEKALLNVDTGKVVLKGDYYHDKIMSQIDGFVSALKYLNVEYEMLSDKHIDRYHELFDNMGFYHD